MNRTDPAPMDLAAWRHPNCGLVAPGTFIALAEEIRLIAPLGEWVNQGGMHEGSWLAGRSQGRGQAFGRSIQKFGASECHRERPYQFGFVGRALRTGDYRGDFAAQ
jgi:hypothetical protein